MKFVEIIHVVDVTRIIAIDGYKYLPRDRPPPPSLQPNPTLSCPYINLYHQTLSHMIICHLLYVIYPIYIYTLISLYRLYIC